MNTVATSPISRSLAMLLTAAAVALSSCGGGGAAAQTPSSGEPSGPHVAVVARDLAFDQAEIDAPANTAFTIVFENREAVPHNVSIDRTEGGRARAFDGAVFTGPATRWYVVPALSPGAYVFLCQVHPDMTGRLVVS
jgi:plastocyanin